MTGKLRITGGALSRRLIDVPPAAARGLLRPTSDRVREALFSSLQSRIDFDGIAVLDLCCGSGALGFEALSRGAAHCTFVDHDKRTLAVTKANANILDVAARCTFIAASLDDVKKSIPRAAFNLVLCDPPYALPLDERRTSAITEALTTGGLLVVERAKPKGGEALPIFAGLSLVDQRLYGDTQLLFLEAA